MQFALCLLACLFIVGDAFQLQDDYEIVGNVDERSELDRKLPENLNKLQYQKAAEDWEHQFKLQAKDSSSNDNSVEIDFEKRGRSRTRLQMDNDRGNRDMQIKFKHEMVQCRGEVKRISLYDVIRRSQDEVQFYPFQHSPYNDTLMVVECVQVDDNDAKRVHNPCEYFPQNSIERLCYVHGKKCDTVQKAHVVLMRDIGLDRGHNGEWYTKTLQLNAGCYCNREFHY